MKEENILYVGVDVASKINVAAFLNDRDKQASEPLSFANNQQGAQKLEGAILKTARKEKSTLIKVATEATSFYDFHLADFLSESQALAGLGCEVYRFNPKITHHFKKTLQELEKTDLVDALVIAKRLRFGNLPCPYHSLKDYLPLQRLTRYRFHLLKEIVREKGFLLTHLFLKNSSLTTDKPIKRVLGATSRVILQEYLTGEAVAEAPLEDLTKLIVKASKNRIKEPNKLAELLQRISRESYRLRPNLAKTLDLIVCSCFRNIRSYQDSLKEVNQAVAEQLQGFKQTLTSVPGIGPVLAAGLLAEIGDINRFYSTDALAKYAGLWWPRKQSGEFEASERKLRKAGNQYLRYYLVEAANSMRVHNTQYQAFYQKKYREVRLHQHKRALVLTARKLVRLVFSLLKNQQLYRS